MVYTSVDRLHLGALHLDNDSIMLHAEFEPHVGGLLGKLFDGVRVTFIDIDYLTERFGELLLERITHLRKTLLQICTGIVHRGHGFA